MEKLSLYVNALKLQNRVGRNGGAGAFAMTECRVAKKRNGRTPEEIEKAVNRAVKIGGLFGGLDSCLSRSVIRCRLMRKSGIEARVVSGLNKKDGSLEGHTWVVWPGGPSNPPRPDSYSSVTIHPSPEKFPGWTPET